MTDLLVAVVTLLAFLAGLTLLSYMALRTRNPVAYQLTGGGGVFLGFYWYDAFNTNLALAFGLALLAYGLLMFGIALRLIFWSEDVRDEDETIS